MPREAPQVRDALALARSRYTPEAVLPRETFQLSPNHLLVTATRQELLQIQSTPGVLAAFLFLECVFNINIKIYFLCVCSNRFHYNDKVYEKGNTKYAIVHDIKGAYITVQQSKKRSYYMPSFHRNISSELFFLMYKKST